MAQDLYHPRSCVKVLYIPDFELHYRQRLIWTRTNVCWLSPLDRTQQDAVFLSFDCIDSYFDTQSAHCLLSFALSALWLIAWRFTALDKLEPNGRTNEDQHFFNSSRSQNSSRGTELCFNAPDQGFSKFGFYLTFKTPFVLSSVQHSSVWSQVFKQIGADSLKPSLINRQWSQLGKHLFFTNPI